MMPRINAARMKMRQPLSLVAIEKIKEGDKCEAETRKTRVVLWQEQDRYGAKSRIKTGNSF